MPVEVGGVHVKPGELLFGDRDGVVVIPRDVERETIERAWEKATGERTVGNAIRQGMSVEEAFRKYGIL